MFVSDSDRFNYSSVYYNQTQDVHPPLFYFVLHTISSVFPNEFTKWTGLGINLVAYLVSIILMYCILQELNISELSSMLCCLIYAISKAGLSTFLMIRMYMLLTMFTLLLVYLVIKMIKNDMSIKYAIAVGLTIFLGMFTQYFYVIYAFCVCAAVDIWLLIRKRWKDLIQFSVPALLGVGMMLVLFPYWYSQLHSQKVVSLDTVADNAGMLGQYLYRIAVMGYQFIKNIPIAVLLYGVLVILLFNGKFRKFIKSKISVELVLVFIPAVMAFIIASIIEPYLDIRYVYNILPIMIIPVCYVMEYICGVVDIKKKNLYSVVLVIICIIAGFVFEPRFVYSSQKNENEKISLYNSSPCIYYTSNYNPSITSNIAELIDFDNVCIFNDVKSDHLYKYISDYIEADKVVLFIAEYPDKQDDSKLIKQIKEKYGYVTDDKLASQDFSNIYVLSK